MVGKGWFRIDEPDGERWEVALNLLREGVQAVQVGHVVLRRDTIGPQADQHIHAAILATYGPASLTRHQAERDISEGREVIADLRRRDDRFNQLVVRHGIVVEYLDDYGMGSLLLARVGDDGAVSWHGSLWPDT